MCSPGRIPGTSWPRTRPRHLAPLASVLQRASTPPRGAFHNPQGATRFVWREVSYRWRHDIEAEPRHPSPRHNQPTPANPPIHPACLSRPLQRCSPTLSIGRLPRQYLYHHISFCRDVYRSIYVVCFACQCIGHLTVLVQR